MNHSKSSIYTDVIGPTTQRPVKKGTTSNIPTAVVKQWSLSKKNEYKIYVKSDISVHHQCRLPTSSLDWRNLILSSNIVVFGKNRRIHQSLLLLLRNRPELASRVKYLSIYNLPAHVLFHARTQIIRRCSSLNELCLCLQQKYKTGKRTEKLSITIRKVNPTVIKATTMSCRL